MDREGGQATTLLFALSFAPLINIYCGNYATAATELHEAVALADDKGIQFLKAIGMSNRGLVLALTGKASDAVEVLISGITAMRSMGSTFLRSLHLSSLATAYVELNNYEDAWRCISEAMIAVETNKERWCEADIHRIAGQIALRSSEPDAAKAEAHFARALAVARQQQAKSWELRRGARRLGLGILARPRSQLGSNTVAEHLAKLVAPHRGEARASLRVSR